MERMKEPTFRICFGKNQELKIIVQHAVDVIILQ